jgi:DNA polymerase-3 subunit delta
MGMTHTQIIRDLQLKKFHPVYFLCGEETFFIDQIVKVFQDEILDEVSREFGLHLLYGKEVELNQVISMAKGFPMLGDLQIVIVKEAQDLKEWKKSELTKSLENYIQQPTNTTLLVFEYRGKKLDGKLKISKLIESKTHFFHAEKIKDNKVPDWILQYASDKGFKISKNISELVAAHLGNDLSKIVNEINKLSIVFPQGTELNSQIIQDYIGISKDYNPFELQKALLEKNVIQANRIVEYYIKNPKDHALPGVVAILFGFFNRLNIYVSAENKTFAAQQLKLNDYTKSDYLLAAKNFSPAKMDRIIGYLLEADKRSKGVEAGQMGYEDILLELVFKILH